MIKYKTKYYTYKFLNRRHSDIEKKIVSKLTFLTISSLGLPDSFKAELNSEIFLGEFKLVVRRVAWLMQFSFLKRPLIKDDYFDFSLGLSYEAAKDMYQYVKKRRSFYREAFLYELTLAQISSAVMESQVKPGECIEVQNLNSNQFDSYFLAHLSKAKVLMAEEVKHPSSDQKERVINARPEFKEKFKPLSVNLMERHGLQVMHDVLALREKLAINIFVISGTFLGLHREAGFLAHDYDIDLGVFAIEFNNCLLDELNQLEGFVDVSLDYPCFREVEAGCNYIS